MENLALHELMGMSIHDLLWVALGGAAIILIWGLAKAISDKMPDALDYTFKMRAETSIVDKLVIMLDRYQADRVFVAEYSNGTHNIASVSQMKVSVRDEVTRGDIESVSMKIQNVPSAYFSEWTKLLLDNKRVKIPDTESLRDSVTPHLHKFFSVDQGVKSMYLFPLKDLDGRLFGIGAIEYCKETHKMTEAELDMCCSDFGKITGILMQLRVFTDNKKRKWFGK